MNNQVFSAALIIFSLIGCARETHKEFIYDDDGEALRKLESADRKPSTSSVKIPPGSIPIQQGYFAVPNKISVNLLNSTINIVAPIGSVSLAAVAENANITPARVTVGTLKTSEIGPRLKTVANSDGLKHPILTAESPSFLLSNFVPYKEIAINKNGSFQIAFSISEPTDESYIVLAINHQQSAELRISTYEENPKLVAKRISPELTETPPTAALIINRFIFDSTWQSNQFGKISITAPDNINFDLTLNDETLMVDLIATVSERISWNWQVEDKALAFNSFIEGSRKNQYLVTGDLSLDGSLNSEDSGVIVKFASGLENLSVAQKLSADFNGDKEVTRMDAVYASIIGIKENILLPVKTGDLNYNGIISQKDRQYLSQTIEQNKGILFGSEWDSTHPTLLMDLNSDGLVNNSDLTLLSLYLDGSIKKIPLVPFDLNGDGARTDVDRKILEDFIGKKASLDAWQMAVLVDNYPDNVIDLKDFDVGSKFYWRYYYGYLPLRKGRLRTERTANGLPAINEGDADIIRSHIAQTITLTGELFEMADINDDKIVDSTDLDQVESLISGDLSSWPPASSN